MRANFVKGVPERQATSLLSDFHRQLRTRVKVRKKLLRRKTFDKVRKKLYSFFLLLISALSFLVSEVIFTKNSERKTKCSATNAPEALMKKA